MRFLLKFIVEKYGAEVYFLKFWTRNLVDFFIRQYILGLYWFLLHNREGKPDIVFGGQKMSVISDTEDGRTG